MPYILLTQLDDKPILLNSENFLFFAAYQAKITKGNVTTLTDCTNCVINDEVGVLVKETPQDIMEAIDYANTEGEYENGNRDDDGWESDETEDGEKVCHVSAPPS